MNKAIQTLAAAVLLAAQAGASYAAVTAEEAGKLGSTLTLLGAEKAGNKDGTIPEYTGGLTTAPASYVQGSGVRPDPFVSEKPSFSIDARNIDQYADRLTEGTKAVLRGNADFRLDVYPTHRTAAVPQWVLENTLKNATRAKLSDDGLSMSGAKGGIPFPIPKNGNEVMFNFLARYQGVSTFGPKVSSYNVLKGSKPMLASQFGYIIDRPYYDRSAVGDPSVLVRYRVDYTSPARRVGEVLLVVDPIDYTDRGRRGWQYMPGQRRVRVAPDVAYETPDPATSGMTTYDDNFLFNGKMDRFEWKLVGKKEMYVPYNGYRATYHDSAEELFQQKFVNPSLLRWELHRVWVVEAKLKEGQRHIYSKRVFYIDEDSWSAVASDQYDNSGNLWRMGLGVFVQCYEAQTPNVAFQVFHDLIAGSYSANGWPGTGGNKILETLPPESTWSPDALAGSGIR